MLSPVFLIKGDNVNEELWKRHCVLLSIIKEIPIYERTDGRIYLIFYKVHVDDYSE